MEFWGVEVKSGVPLKVDPVLGSVVHISQVALGELKKDTGSQTVLLHLKHDNRQLVIGTLSHEKFPQISLDLVLEKQFELSHSWKDGSVYFTGYTAPINEGIDETDTESDSDIQEGLPVAAVNGQQPEAKEANPSAAKKPDTSGPKQVNFVEPKKDAKTEESDSSDDEEDDSDDDDSSDDQEELTINGEDDDSNEEDDSDEDDDDSDEEDHDNLTPEKPEPSKKRSGNSATKTPVPMKKSKLDTPQKTDGKKVGGHTATPHPAKKTGKTLANTDQKKPQAQKSGGSYPCKSCKKAFSSEVGLQSHTKAKHGAAA
ncbi:hypothetical protein CFOL_v3_05217 [Cephalotus follicularis]|uniref:C2H2-type domain-containing protein n=1 Tax=Cephalotus follicularis TaxID=3775 RepID=A0A1Q3B156_CEPFO|nr:hypothetical protein CFOL_v3_05217 [Cephalotus follicularis]